MRCPLCGEAIPREDEELGEEVCIDCKQAMFTELDRLYKEFNINGWTGFSDVVNEWVSETWNKEIHK